MSVADFFKENKKSIYGLARKYAPLLDVDDVVADVLFNVLKYERSGRPIENMQRFVFTSIHRRAIDAIRRKDKSISFDGWFEDEDIEPFHTTIRDHTENQEERRAHVEQQSLVRSAVAQLSVSERELAELMLEGFRSGEIASILQESPGSVYVRICRTKQHLKEIILISSPGWLVSTFASI